MPPERIASDASDPVGLIAERVRAGAPRSRRRMIAVAGPPASGKSELAAELVTRIEGAVLAPMDGFHLDNRLLARRGLMHRKGAPETFDAAGFVRAMLSAAAGEEVVLPDFDRGRDIAIAGAIEIGPDCGTVVAEGNYLCATEGAWARLAPLWDLSVFLDVPEAVLRERLLERWRRHGLAPDEARRRAEENDLPNARYVAASAGNADLLVSFQREPASGSSDGARSPRA